MGMKTTCRACGIEFEDPRQRRRRNPFCSPLCATAQAMTERLLGNAIIRVNQSSVTCLLCSKELRCAGSHFERVHGLKTSHRLTDRQEAYGLPEGSRVEPEDMLEAKSKRARDGKFGRATFYEEVKRVRRDRRLQRSSPGRSAAQLLQSKTKFADAGRVHNRENMKAPRVCQTCSRLFRNRRGVKRNQKYCSIECRPVTEAAITTLGNNTAKAHAEAMARNTIACEWCKKEFLPASRPGRGVRFCSAKCVQAKASAERPVVVCTADGCANPSRSRGMCTRHYQQWKMRQRQQVVVCEWCRTEFTTSKRGGQPLARFCSSRCQMKNRYKDRPVAMCSADGCSLPTIARGLCDKHYRRQKNDNPKETT